MAIAPKTPFEIRGQVAPWTSLSDGDAFLDALGAYSPRVTTEILGKTEGGANLRLVKLSAPTPAARTVLYVAQQHGGELSGREAMFTRLRDWADSADPAIASYLQSTTILCIPTAHPDGDRVRNNVNDVNINRDHLNVTQKESQLIQKVIRDYRPSLIVDLHEGSNIVQEYATSPPLNSNIDNGVLGLANDLHEKVKNAILGSGHTWELYQGGNIVGPEYFQNAGGLRNAVTILLETRRVYDVDTDAKLRHDLQLIAVDAIMDWHMKNRAAIEVVTDGAAERATASKAPFKLLTGTIWPGNAPTIATVPDGYVLTPEAHAATSRHRELFGIVSSEHDGEYLVKVGQATRGLIPYLLDPASIVGEADGAAWFKPAPPELHPPLVPIGSKVHYRVRIGSQTLDPIAVRLRLGGRTITLTGQALSLR